jgi:hypothetical protein
MPKPLTLIVLPGCYAICRLAADAPWPEWAAGEFVTMSRTAEELSIVCAQDAVPAGVRCEPSWRCLRVAGTLDFAAIGVLASLVNPLAEAGVSVFVVSTFDTDYLLVKEHDFERACAALRRCGGMAISCKMLGGKGGLSHVHQNESQTRAATHPCHP